MHFDYKADMLIFPEYEPISVIRQEPVSLRCAPAGINDKAQNPYRQKEYVLFQSIQPCIALFLREKIPPRR